MKYFFSLLLYRLLLITLAPVIILFFLLLSLKKPAFRLRLSERLGFLPNNMTPNGLVIHAASVGEVLALKSFIEQLLQANPKESITITTFTPTGSEQVIKLFGNRVQHCYLPLDIFFCTKMFLNRLQPKAVVFMETEIWPNLIKQISTQDIKLLLVNARLSESSMKSYKKLTWLITPSLKAFNQILPQSQANLTHFLTLGASSQACTALGNVKFDISHTQATEDKKIELSSLLPKNRDIWLVASTHKGDEELALTAYRALLATQPTLLLVIVPRHPERFVLVHKLSQQHHFNVKNRSDNTAVDSATQVWVLDTLGELMAGYALSTIVTMGGSFSDINGHNPLEPALYKKPVVVGPYMKNFAEITQQLTQVNGLISLSSVTAEALADTIEHLLTDKARQKTVGENAYQVVLNNQGASEKSLRVLHSLLFENNHLNTIKQDAIFCQFHSSLFELKSHRSIVSNPMNHVTKQEEILSHSFLPCMLSPEYWQEHKAITGSAQGRGTTWFIEYNKHQWVLRHYYRGGLIGKINKDHYIFTSYKNTRAAKEFALLNQMQKWQLPAPKPVAYRIIRQGLTYQADLLSTRIENAQDLVAVLSQQTLTKEIWRKIGATLKKFHDKGIYHHDLNSHNILLDDKLNAWVIDFDRGEHREVAAPWQEANMARLLRSFRKEKGQLDNFHWHEADWDCLIEGYKA